MAVAGDLSLEFLPLRSWRADHGGKCELVLNHNCVRTDLVGRTEARPSFL